MCGYVPTFAAPSPALPCNRVFPNLADLDRRTVQRLVWIRMRHENTSFTRASQRAMIAKATSWRLVQRYPEPMALADKYSYANAGRCDWILRSMRARIIFLIRRYARRHSANADDVRQPQALKMYL